MTCKVVMLVGVVRAKGMGWPAYRLAIATGPSEGGRYAGYGTPAGELGEVDVLSYGGNDERSAKSEGLDEMHRVVRIVFRR